MLALAVTGLIKHREADMRTQVAIIGGGPAGLMLCHMLQLDGIESVVLEKYPRQRVLQRIRAGVRDAGSVTLLRDVGLGDRSR